MARLLIALGSLALLVAVVLAVLRLLSPDKPEILVGLTAAAPYGVWAGVFGLLCWLAVAALRRNWLAWLGVAASALVLAPLVAWQLPLYFGEVPDEEPNLVVIAVNCRYGMCDVESVSELVRRHEVDVLVFSELTPAAATRFARTDAARVLTHSFGEPADGIAGTVTFSRLPLSNGRVIPMDSGMHVVEVGGERPFTLSAVHTGQPLQDAARWREHLKQVQKVSSEIEGPVVSAGDFNASLDHAQLRAAIGSMRDAAEQANSGWQPTWQPEPGALPLFSPKLALLTLDHVFVGGGVDAVRTQATAIDGTDHLAVVAWLSLP